MNGAAHIHEERCEWERATAAYLDGELEDASAAIFEAHAKECAACAGALREQRRLLCLLDNAFDETFEKRVALPADFTRVVKARAQTDMSGVRERRERTISLKICLALTFSIFALLGAPAFDALAPVMDAARAVAGVAGLIGNAALDAGAGTLVIARAVGGRLVADTNSHALLQWLLFACALALLLRMIGKYHRAGVND
jgi:anti-sigma factor RsiW